MTASLQAPELTVSTAAATVEAGQPLEVTVRFVADRPTEVTGGQVELVRSGAVAHSERGWMGAGATVSSRRSAVLGRADLDPVGPLVAGQHLVRSVTLAVPAGEATVDGYLVQQEYGVRARLQVHHGRDVEASTAVVVTSRAADRSWVTGTAAVVDEAGVAALGLEEVSSRRLSGGVPVSGTVTVTPRRAAHARGVRVELVLAEQVPARLPEMPLEEDRTRTTVVATVALAGPVDLEPGAVLRLPFTIRAPLPLPAPSMSAPEFTLRWLLRAVLDRPRRPDPTSTVEQWAATAP
ncbi:hypothetical protein ACI79C_01890 [Geodermatophilus sp. SYSU D00697]